MSTCTITRHGVDGLDDAMQIMAVAFDARFGEAWTASQVTGVLSMPGSTLFVGRTDRPIGFALTRRVCDEAELMLLAVTPVARRSGVGRALVENSMELAREAGVQRYFLEVRSDNPAMALYSRLALEVVGVRRGYYRGNDGVARDALTLRMDLSSSR